MDATENSKLPLVAPDQYPPSIPPSPQNPHAHSSNFYPMFSTMEFNELKNETTEEGNSFTPCEDTLSGNSYCDVVGESCCAKSDTDSCSEVGDNVYDNEVSLDEVLLNDAKAKKKLEVLAEMVGVDSTEPVIVLTEVVRVLKHLQRMNQF